MPSTIKLRNDAHFVEELDSRRWATIGRMIPIEEIDPNPNQPRQQMGDLSELTASIREKGILEPLIVRGYQGHYQIISGERRYQAALQAGLTELPCVLRDVDDQETIELALVENIQRKDLTPFEEAEAFGMLVNQHGYTHEALASRIGKSRTSVTESLSLNSMPEDIKNLCRLADITSKSLLLQVVRQDSPQKMAALVEKISAGQLNRDQARRSTRKPQRGRPKNFVFRYGERSTPFRLQMTFRRSEVERGDVILALRQLLSELEAGDGPL
ncbi:MAG TPA: ParB/RepB/Spo0J family partition protein [Vicinamibacteria bacterium]|nr:ParB/RepB/Spo0J family partition protein [Vicinamibacteria bacterium]